MTKDNTTLIHFGVRGMRWGIRKERSGSGGTGGAPKQNGKIDTTSPKSSKGTERYEKALAVNTRAQKAVDDADDAWVDAFYKGDKKGMAAADSALNTALVDAKRAKNALKNAEKSNPVVQAEKARAKAREAFEKADDEWVKSWDKNNGKPDPSVDRAFKEAQKNYKQSKSDLYKAKTNPFEESVNLAKKKQEDAWKVLEKADNEWVQSWDKNKGKIDPVTAERFNAANKIYKQATSDLRKEKRARTFARASAFLDNIIEY